MDTGNAHTAHQRMPPFQCLVSSLWVVFFIEQQRRTFIAAKKIESRNTYR
jgi:hypothetical protein